MKSFKYKKIREIPGILKSKDFEAIGISRHRIPGMIRSGEVERIERGLYRRTSVKATENETIAMVGAKIPNGVFCLLTALRIHDIGTQNPGEIWLAIESKARIPRTSLLPVRIVRFSRKMMATGVIEKKYQGVSVRITSPERTVVDCFRFRNKIGMDVALEALSDVIRRRIIQPDDIVRTAKNCRAFSVIKPYLESMLV